MRTIAAGTAMCAGAFLLAACGGGGGGASPTAVLPGTIATATPVQGSGTLSVTIVVPPVTSTSSTARTTKYISPSTQSVTISLKGAATNLAVTNVTAGSAGCTTGSAGITCTVTATAPAGDNLYAVSAYDGLNGSGNKLSTANVPATITASATTRLPLTLNGVVSSVAVSLGASSIPAGAKASVSVTITAYDASHNVIVGPGTFDTAVTLVDSDATGVTSLSTTSVQAPGTSVALNYTGNSLMAATITPFIGNTAYSAATLVISGSAFAAYPLQGTTFNGSTFYNIVFGGPSNNLWFTDGDNMGSISTTGLQSAPFNIDVNMVAFDGGTGSAKALYYFTDDGCGDDSAGTIDTVAQTATDATNSTGSCYYASLCGTAGGTTAGPDGNAWFGDYYYGTNTYYIGRVTPQGDIHEWDLSTLSGYTNENTIEELAFSADGSQMYAIDSAQSLDRITMSGGVPTAIASVALPYAGASIAMGYDGNPWFTDSNQGIGMVPSANFTAGAVSEWNASPRISYQSYISQLIATPDALWGITNNSNDGPNVFQFSGLAGVTPASGPVLTIVPAGPSGVLAVDAITVGPDHNIWISTAPAHGAPLIHKIIYGTSTGSSLTAFAATRLSAGGTRVALTIKKRQHRKSTHGKRKVHAQ